MLKAICDHLHQDLLSDKALLLPLRLFIGLGWLRASVEKFIEPAWYDGSALTSFLNHHLSAGHMIAPMYEQLTGAVFLPAAPILAWVIMIGQLLAGIALITGTFTQAALLGGLFMNINFIAAGAVNPSAFYVVMQMILLVLNAGAVLSVDAYLAKKISNPWLVAQSQSQTRRGRTLIIALFFSLFTALCLLPHIDNFGPHSVDDPAMLGLILSMLSSCVLIIKLVQLRHKNPTSFQTPLAPTSQKPLAPSSIVTSSALVMRDHQL